MTASPGPSGASPASRLTHDELSTPAEMSADCRAVTRNVPRLERALRKATSTPPSIRFEDYPAEVRKREISIDQAAVRLAGALHLHLD